jgi:Kef-type K+ transport system membrane component KefB
VLALGGVVVLALVVWFAGRRVTRVLFESDRIGDQGRLLGTVALLFLMAWYTDEIGLYAVFGAFVLGMVMPRNERADKVVDTLTPIASTVFVPLFFTYSGLRTQFGLFGDPKVLTFAVACVVLAIVGKFGACWGAARLRGESNEVALRVGALMNARGLMQLIALNVGLDAGIVNSALFTVLVLVALVTTIMTSPMLAYLERRSLRAASPDSEIVASANVH